MTHLDRYVGNAVLKAFATTNAGLTALFSLLEFVEQLKSVGQGTYQVWGALVYVLLTAPARVLQVAPVSMLLGCLLALGALAKESELTAMRAVGMAESRIILAALKVLPPVILVLFLVAEFIVPSAQHKAMSLRSAALSDSALSDQDDSFWAGSNHQYMNVQLIESKTELRGLTVYVFADTGRLQSYIHADQAQIQPDGPWLLRTVTRKTITPGERFKTEHLDTLAWTSFIPGKRVQELTPAPEFMAPTALVRYVWDMERQRQHVVRYEQELWGKVAIPFALFAMVMISLPFVFGPPRAQNTGQKITIGAVIGIVFSLAQQISDRLDLLLDLSPAVTALAPSVILTGVAVYLFQRAHAVRPVPPAPPLDLDDAAAADV